MVEQVNVQSPYSKPLNMGKSIIECVPNISEGRDIEKINRIVDAARIPGVKILGIVDLHEMRYANDIFDPPPFFVCSILVIDTGSEGPDLVKRFEIPENI